MRRVERRDQSRWLAMRSLLWPDSHEDHAAEIELFLAGESRHIDAVFVSNTLADEVVGFLEMRVRNYAEGSSEVRVPYVEGWFVEGKARGMGIGGQLMKRAERWAQEQGFAELASDAEIDNDGSIAAHRALGFREVDRTVSFLKSLR